MAIRKTHLLLLAGGKGTRLGSETPKQFLPIDNIPIIVYTLKRFQSDLIDDITIVCKSDWIEYLKELIKNNNIQKVVKIVSGGDTTHQSIFNGLKYIKTVSADSDIVVIHDSVRPLVSQFTIRETIQKALLYGNACAAMKPIEGLVIKESDECGMTPIERHKAMSIQTPQAYKSAVIFDVYDMANQNGQEYSYAERAILANGIPLFFSKSFATNIKITTKSDFTCVKAMIHSSEKELIDGNDVQ